MLCGSLDGRGVWGRMDTYRCMAESLCCPPETITTLLISYQFSSVAQSCLGLCNPMDCSTPGFPVHHQLPELAQTHAHKLVMPSNPLILCHPLLLPPSFFPSIRVFSSESTVRMRWPKYWSFSFSIISSKEHPGLISFRMDWLDLLAALNECYST